MALFNKALINSIENDFEAAVEYFGGYKDEIIEQLNALSGDELYCMKFIYGNAPLSDIADSPFGLLLGYVRHSLYARDAMPWGHSVPVDVFLSDVLFPRINTEGLDGCRKILYEMTVDRVKGKNMVDAVIEANYWCLENATYRTTDMRTSPPLTVINRAYGRCGEESTLTVNVLRSLCIPARQIYTPRWAHCDSNHAWTEAWCDGKWHYLGACEPEPVLDRGWFDTAATRAMLLHSRTFYKNVADDFKITDEGPISTINRLPDYGKCTTTKVLVTNQGHPVGNAKVVFEIINYAAFSPISTLFTDKNGCAEIISGLGSMMVRVIHEGKFIEKLIHTGETTVVAVDMQDGVTSSVGITAFETIAPLDAGKGSTPVTGEMKAVHKKRFAKCTELRRQKEEGFVVTSSALKDFRAYYNREKLDGILFKAKGNGGKVVEYLDSTASPFGYDLLCSLTEKDYTDLKPEILKSHLDWALPYAEEYGRDIFVPYILNPRVGFENLTDYRPFIDRYFTKGQKEAFRENPALVYGYIKDNIRYCIEKEYDSLFTSPEGALRLQKASPQSQFVLFVAVCRTLGIPARLNPETREIEYYDRELGFVSPLTKEPHDARLHIAADTEIQWGYRTNWTLSILEDGEYKPLWLDCSPGEVQDIPLKAGFYRIITANRLPNGNIYAKSYSFELPDGKTTEVSIELPQFELKDMLINISLNDFNLIDLQDIPQPVSSMLWERNVLVWLEENEEPTEHILNELADNWDKYKKTAARLFFVVRNKACLDNRNIARVMGLIPSIQGVVDPGFEMREPVARNLYVDPEKLPLAVVTDKNLEARYASAGYNVGLGDLLLKIVEI